MAVVWSVELVVGTAKLRKNCRTTLAGEHCSQGTAIASRIDGACGLEDCKRGLSLEKRETEREQLNRHRPRDGTVETIRDGMHARSHTRIGSSTQLTLSHCKHACTHTPGEADRQARKIWAWPWLRCNQQQPARCETRSPFTNSLHPPKKGRGP